MSRTRVFVPSNFAVDYDGLKLKILNCKVIKYDGINMTYANRFLNEFKGNVTLIDCDIYTEDNPLNFIDKIEFLTGKQREEFLS